MSSASGLAAMFGFVIDTRLMARFCENQFFHNSISCYNIQGTVSCFEKKQQKKKTMTVFGFSACVVAVATFDGCVCQAIRPCSLMMAMPAYVWVYICVCV